LHIEGKIGMKNKKHSEETKEKISSSRKLNKPKSI
jgi:hypothetical protein